MAVEFGIHLGLNTVGDPAPDRLAYYRGCLAVGEDALKALWLSDHLQKGEAPVLEAWTTLSYVAALAPSYRVGNMVLGQSYRNPALLAKMAATLQILTAGRFVLGIGAGWQEDEYLAYGYPFPRAGERIEQLSEAVDLIRTMWTRAPANYQGKHYVVRDAHCEPRPDPPPQVLIGGQGPKLMRLAAAKADAWTWDGPLEIFHAPHRRLVDGCQQIGRPISEIKLIAEFDAYFPADRADFPAPRWSGYLDFMTSPLGPTPAQARAEIMRLVEIGVEEFCVYFYDLRTLHRFVDEVVPQFSYSAIEARP
jgi:alkanesulfonate monooxygenase SsuD/methylene tetrahydromethanopterin reductase-like flavin-dependent oxidoreductase (luciferase family)